MSPDRFRPEKFVKEEYVPMQYTEAYIKKLEADNIRLREVIKNRNEVISKLKLMLRPFWNRGIRSI